MKKTNCLITILTITGSLLSLNALADNAADIENGSGSTTYDGAPGGNPVITSILSAPGTVDGYTYTKYEFLAQDSTGSLEMYMSSSATYSGAASAPAVGDTITSSGTYAPYDAIPEFSSSAATITGTGAAVPSTPVVTIPSINQTSTMANGLLNQYSGYYVQLDDVTISGVTGPTFTTHANVTGTITDGSGNSMVLYLWASSYSAAAALGGTTVPTGAVDLDGFVDFYSGSSEAEFIPTAILPATTVPEPSMLNLCGAGSALAYVVSRLRKKA